MGGGTQQAFDIFLYASLFMMYFITVRQLILRQTMTYSEMYNNDTLDLWMNWRFFSLALGTISILRHRHVKFVLYSWLFFCVAYLAAGTRSMGIAYVGLILMFVPLVYPNLSSKKYSIIWMAGAFLGMAVLNIISSTRNGGTVEADSILMSALMSIEEMGASVRPLIESMNSAVSLGYPQTILYAFLEFVMPAGIVDCIVPHNWTINLGQWINTLHNENNEWGFSFTAEAFVNFGNYGWLFMIFYGYLIAYIENESYKRIKNGNYLFAACFLAILARQLFFARGQIQLSIDFCRPAFYTFLFYLFFLKRKTIK